jgi:hypothetical protein
MTFKHFRDQRSALESNAHSRRADQSMCDRAPGGASPVISHRAAQITFHPSNDTLSKSETRFCRNATRPAIVAGPENIAKKDDLFCGHVATAR